MQSSQDPHPWHSDPQWEGISQTQMFSLRSKGFELYIRQPSPGDLHLEDDPI